MIERNQPPQAIWARLRESTALDLPQERAVNCLARAIGAPAYIYEIYIVIFKLYSTLPSDDQRIWPLCSLDNARFVYLLPRCSPMLPLSHILLSRHLLRLKSSCKCKQKSPFSSNVRLLGGIGCAKQDEDWIDPGCDM